MNVKSAPIFALAPNRGFQEVFVKLSSTLGKFSTVIGGNGFFAESQLYVCISLQLS